MHVAGSLPGICFQHLDGADPGIVGWLDVNTWRQLAATCAASTYTCCFDFSGSGLGVFFPRGPLCCVCANRGIARWVLTPLFLCAPPLISELPGCNECRNDKHGDRVQHTKQERRGHRITLSRVACCVPCKRANFGAEANGCCYDKGFSGVTYQQHQRGAAHLAPGMVAIAC